MSRKHNKHPYDVTEQNLTKKASIAESGANAEILETVDYDYKREKPPAKSTYHTHIRKLNKHIAQSANTTPGYNSFDRLKLCIDLRLYDETIEFELRNMEHLGVNEEPKSFIEKKMDTNRMLQVITTRSNVVNLLEKFDKARVDDDIDEIVASMINRDSFLEEKAATNTEPKLEQPETETESITPEKVEDEEETYPERIDKCRYLNCWIEQHKLPLGLNAFYIEDDRLIMDITGKFMASTGNLGLINIHNIIDCFNKIKELNYVNFNVAKAIEVMTVRLCDVTLDIKTMKQGDYIRAISSIYPFYSDKNTIKKYGNTSILIKSKADKVKKSFIIYDKGKEVSYQRGKFLEYWHKIGDKGLEVAYNTLRLEAHLYTFDSMRKYLELPDGEIKLSSLLRSKAPVMLNILKDYDITEEKLRDKIKAHIDLYLPLVDNIRDLINTLAADRVAELQACQRVIQLLEHQQFEFSALVDMVALEKDITSNEKLMKELSPFLKHSCYTYLLHYKPKTIKLLLDLLDIIHTAYGRNFGMDDNDLPDVA